jgi:tight adherence protein C
VFPADLIPILFFVCITAGVMALALLLSPARDRAAERVRGLAGGEPQKAEAGLLGRLVRRGFSWIAAPAGGHKGDRLRLRLVNAGYDAPHAAPALRAVRLALALVPPAAAAVVVAAGLLSPRNGAIAGGIAAGLGLIAPGMWLDGRKKKHQTELRRGLPDFFDVIVLCVEGGMSLLAAWRRVADELRLAYPTLWKELKLVEQEVEIGRPMSEALRGCSERTDLEDTSRLASVVRQAEMLGTELSRPMRNLSDTLRQQRVQRAEEAAHKTATKIMFPTLLFIFPCVFAVLLGPMIAQVMNIFSGGKP